ncbi:MAG: hypothetical protein L0191_18050 [Acidobacteria bacterium]|nr:hypothetical protein [Acidobacteriota bacterium]
MNKIPNVPSLMILLALTVVIPAGSATPGAEGAAKAGVFKGELVDSRCYLMMGKKGPEHQKCAVACAKDGLPLGLVDAKGNYYTLVIQASQVAESSGLQAEVEGTLKGNSIVPTKIKIQKDGAWTEVKMPEQMM